MKRSSEQAFRKFLKAYGIIMPQYSGGHFKLTHKGRQVASLSHTGDSNAIKACMGDLVRQNLLPREAKRKVF